MSDEEREQLWRRLRGLQTRQADLRELRAWMEGRSSDRATAWPHDAAFLRETQAIVDWLNDELAAVERQLLGKIPC